jgi:hypothetical protein
MQQKIYHESCFGENEKDAESSEDDGCRVVEENKPKKVESAAKERPTSAITP